MSATPDRPATTPEGAGLAELSAAATPGPWEVDGVCIDGEGSQPVAVMSVNEEEPEPGDHAAESDARFIVDLVNAYREGRVSERTEGAGEVALREEITGAIADMLSCYDTVMNVAAEARDLSAAVERIIARRALPTAGRVVEVERVERLAELVESEASIASRPGSYSLLSHVAADLHAIAAAIRADGSAES